MEGDTTRPKIGELLVRAGHIGLGELQDGLAAQRRWGVRLGQALIRRGVLSAPDLLSELARQHGVPAVHLATRVVRPSVLELVPRELITSRRVLPVAHANRGARGLLVVATSEPQDRAVAEALEVATGMEVRFVLADERELREAIERHVPAQVERGAPPAPRRSYA